MARLWTCGFELQSAAALVEVLSVTGTPSISTTVHRGGGASLRSNPAAATAYVEQQLDASGLNARSFHRFYLYVAALPSVAATVYAVGQSGYFPVHVQVTATGALQLRDSQNAVNAGTASAPLTVGQWYRVELDVQESGSIPVTREVRGYIEGADFSGPAMIAGSTGYSRVRIGVQTTATTDIHIDDVAVNTPAGTAQTGLPGPGRVVHLRPAGAGDANGWATAVGGTAGAASNWTRVAEVSPDEAATYNETTATGTATIDDYTITAPGAAGIGANDLISVVHVGGRIGSTATTTPAASIAYRLKSQSGGAVVESSSVSVAFAGWRTHKATMPYVPQLTSYTDPQTGTAWTPARLGTAQIGVRSNVSQTSVRRVSALWATVEYQPRTVVALGVAREACAARPVLPLGIPVRLLVDAFDDDVLDTNLWPDSYGGVTEIGGRARVPCTVDYAAYASAKRYRLAGSRASCRIYPAAGGGATTEAWSQLLVTTLTPGTDAMIEVGAADDSLHMALRTAPDYADPGFLSVPYDPVAHAWVRIRETGGVLRWETSPDGAVWTTRRTEPSPAWVNDGTLQVQLIAHRSDGTADYAEFDDLNVSPTVAVIPLGTARTTTAAAPVGHSRTARLDPARTTTVGLPVDHARTARAGAAHQIDQALPVTTARTYRLGAARTASPGMPLAASHTARLATARTSASARTLTAGKRRSLGSARTAAQALPVTTGRTLHLGTARTRTTTHPMGWAHTVRLATATETTTARPLILAGALTLGTARTLTSARPIMPGKVLGLGRATEVSTGRAVGSGRGVVLGTARTAARARTMPTGRTLALGTARTIQVGRPVTVSRTAPIHTARSGEHATVLGQQATAPLGTARTTAGAFDLRVGARTHLGQATSVVAARPLHHLRTVNLGTARASTTAHPVRQPYQTRLVDTARCTDRAHPVNARPQQPADHLVPGTAGPVLTTTAAGPALTPTTPGPHLAATTTAGG